MKFSIGPLGLLGLIFVTLKLCGVITWSWWWVTCPFWVGIGIFFVSIAIMFVAGLIAALIVLISNLFN